MNRDLLHGIISQPTAPFKEQYVQHYLKNSLKKAKIPHFLDPAGNIVVGARSPKDVQALLKKAAKTHHPMRLFIAHMDHPGFHGVEWLSPTQLKAKWYGGSPTQALIGRKVSVYVPNTGAKNEASPLELSCTVESLSGNVSPNKIDVLTLKLDAPAPESARSTSPSEIFGAFTFSKPYWYEGELLHTKAADDLVGVFTIVQTALDHFAKKPKDRLPFLGLLTRGEEVGWIGCIEHLKLGWYKNQKSKNVLAISLETSRQLSDATIGNGVIVRLGDRSSLFSSGPTHLLRQLATLLLPGRHQTRVMDGGSCEASATVTYGIPTIAMSLPLGNYHNQSIEGGSEAGPKDSSAPEFVHLKDLEGMLTLCGALLQKEVRLGENKLTLQFSDPYALRWKSLESAPKAYDNLVYGRRLGK